MNHNIGTQAGIIWTFLNSNGPSSATKIANETGLSKNDVQRSIGWLSCENKLQFTSKGRIEFITLL